jgi:hypothetical protein
MDYVILERNGKFLVGTMEKKRSWFLGKAHDEFVCAWRDFYIPAHFKTLEEAREFVAVITKPDTYHRVTGKCECGNDKCKPYHIACGTCLLPINS